MNEANTCANLVNVAIEDRVPEIANDVALSKDWPKKYLHEVCSFQRGLTYSKADEVEASATVVLRATNINLETNELNLEELRYISDTVVVPIEKLVKADSLIVCMASGSKSHLGKVAFIETDLGYALGGFMGLLIPSSSVLPKYLFHLLTSSSYKSFIGSIADGANINNLTFEKLGMFICPIPPLSEQQRIVRVLDEALEGIAIAKANAEKNLLNARALFRGYLHSAFVEDNDHWQLKRFEDCIQQVQYTRKVQRKQFLREGRFPIISQEAEFNNGFWNDDADLFKVLRPVVIFGDHTRVLKYVDFSFVLGADGVRILPPLEFLNPKFFYYQLLGADIRSLGYSRHYRLLKEMQIRFPSLDEQAKIVSGLDEIAHQSQNLADIYAQKIAAFESLRESVLEQLLMDRAEAA